jgi:hypothetical protein
MAMTRCPSHRTGVIVSGKRAIGGTSFPRPRDAPSSAQYRVTPSRYIKKAEEQESLQ